MGNSGCLTWVRHNGGKSSTTCSYQYVQCFWVSKQWYGSQCLEFLMCAQMLMHAIVHEGCTHTVRESALEVDPGRKIPCHTGDLNQSPYCAQMLMHAIAHEGCTHTVRESALEVDPGRKIPCHTGDSNQSVLHLAFQSGALPTELSLLHGRRRGF